MTTTDTPVAITDLDEDLLAELRRNGIDALDFVPDGAMAGEIFAPGHAFVTPSKAASRARGRERARATRSERRRSRLMGRLVRLASTVRLPPPSAHRSTPPTPSRLDSAAAIGEWMRRRDDPNP